MSGKGTTRLLRVTVNGAHVVVFCLPQRHLRSECEANGMRARQLHKLGIAAALALVVVLATALSALAEGGIGTTLQSSTMIGYARWKTVYGWTIDKSAAPATWELFAGDRSE